ncbi:uncharacterized protein B0J16DRAFT_308062 [Fusarium flagelliforme]|uniref:uncharacterized protein n=1 Tax=Fusarium flagelliforme TaxID=2675880 RepID=UPI001E8E2E5B|nr:uncharacterized protein B0J16DRAFT_308062 [Fusarium flagelliforme]KAH7183682.1 hypothetical protein B0J16DRAFT_308062 [Fusarium flagelliforme]
MSWFSLVKCCGDEPESLPPPRTSAVVQGSTSAPVPGEIVPLGSLRPVNSPVSPVPSQNSQQAQPTDVAAKQQEVFQELWLKAMTQVKASKDGQKLNEVLKTQQISHLEDGDITVTDLFKSLQDEMKRVGLRGKLADMMEDIVPFLNRFAIVGDVAISANPNPAAFPWAAVRFLLLNLTAGQEIRAKIIEGMAEMTILVYQCSVYQEVHLTQAELDTHSTQEKLEEAIVESFVVSIKFLGFALRQQRSAAKAVTDAWKTEDFTGYLTDLTTAKDRLHDAGHMCEIYRGSENHGVLKDMYKIVRQEAITMAEDRAKAQLKDLLVDPKDAVDHMHYPSNSFCLDGTRVAVLEDIKNWAKDPKSPTVCWLPGLAGTGKSTIARTIARDMKGSSFGGAFFFKKGAGNRGNGRFLFSVIAYQLAINIPPLRQNIVDVVEQDDSSVVAPKDIQWRRLVQEPLIAMRNTGLDKPLLLVIDALDECEEDDRGEILTLLASCPTSLKVFITSRPELDIDGHFAKTRLHREIVLHRVDPGTIEQDINTFIRHAISNFVLEYNRAHPQDCMQLQPDWPGNDKTQLLVSRSLPLFIAAATFIRMVKDRHWTKSPDEKIDFIIETSAKVHSQYDPLYKPVLSLILSHSPEDDHYEIITNFTVIIGSFVLLGNSLSVTSLANLLNVEPRVVFGQVDPLRSVIDVPSDDSPIRLFHLSFRDYLVNKSAGGLQVHEANTHKTLAIKCIELMKRKLKQDMCGLGSPGVNRSKVDSETIQKSIPSEVQYACLYWVYHLKLSLDLSPYGDDEYCNNILSEFRSNLFLTWLEVLCFIGRVSDSVEIISELQNLARGDERAEMHQFCQDAMQFVRYFGDCINRTPLQLYFSGVMFAPRLSTAPQPFEHRQYPEWISGPCNNDQSWPQTQQMLQTHYAAIKSINFLQNGRLASVNAEGRVEIWDPASGRCLQSLALSPEDESFSRISSWKSSKIAIASKKGIRIWDLDNSSCYPKLVPIGEEAPELAFSDDGQLLCCAVAYWNSEDGEYTPMLQVWDTEARKFLREFQSPSKDPIFLSGQGQRLASTKDKSLIVSHWDRYHDISWDVIGLCDEEASLEFSLDGTLIASHLRYSGNSSPYPVQIWSLDTKQCLYKFELHARDVALTNKRLAISHPTGGATIIDLEDGLVCGTTSEENYSDINISHDGGFLASFDFEKLKTWDLSKATSIADFDYHKTPPSLITLIADGNTLLSASESDIKIWDICNQVCKETCEIDNVLHLDSQRLASAQCAPYFAIITYSDLEIWQIAPLRRKKVIEMGNLVTCLSISDDGRRLVVGYSTKVELWHLKPFIRTDTLTADGYVKSVVSSDDASQVVIATERSIEVWKLPGTRLLKVPLPEVSINQNTPPFTLVMRGQRLMCCRSAMHVWDIKTGKLLVRWQPGSDDQAPVFDVSFFNFGETVESGDSNYVTLKSFYLTRSRNWVVKDGEKVLWLPLEYQAQPGMSTVILTGSTIVLGSGSGRVLFLPFRH